MTPAEKRSVRELIDASRRLRALLRELIIGESEVANKARDIAASPVLTELITAENALESPADPTDSYFHEQTRASRRANDYGLRMKKLHASPITREALAACDPPVSLDTADPVLIERACVNFLRVVFAMRLEDIVAQHPHLGTEARRQMRLLCDLESLQWHGGNNSGVRQ